jgi:protein-S-isoprenylcysteine O-methyltransferase Ste14
MSRSAAVFTVVFFFLAPGTMAGLVPWLITGWDRPAGGIGVFDVLGVALLFAGLAAVVDCFRRFVTEGSGTPAPVAPTDTLVVGGLYRHVRNPMYLAVGAMIGGQALLLHSAGVGWWLVVFMATVWTFVKGYEEPSLASQFGASYQHYREAVPGWWPRLTAYRADAVRSRSGQPPRAG